MKPQRLAVWNLMLLRMGAGAVLDDSRVSACRAFMHAVFANAPHMAARRRRDPSQHNPHRNVPWISSRGGWYVLVMLHSAHPSQSCLEALTYGSEAYRTRADMGRWKRVSPIALRAAWLLPKRLDQNDNEVSTRSLVVDERKLVSLILSRSTLMHIISTLPGGCEMSC